MAIQKVKDALTIIQSAGTTYQGDDSDQIYLLVPSLIGSGDVITIIDQGGSNNIELGDGLTITSSTVTHNEALFNLSNGASLNIRGADSFTFSVGANSAAGISGLDKSFSTFATDVLGQSLPSEGESPATTTNQSTIHSGGEVDIILADPTTPPTDGDDSLLIQAQAKTNTNSGTGTLPTTGDSPAVESGSYWPTSNITYSYSNTEPSDYASEPGETFPLTGFIAFPDAAKTPSKASFDDIETFAALTFTEVASDGDIRLNVVEQSGGTDGYAFFPDGTAVGGDIFLNNEYTTTEQYAAGGSPFFTVVHEVGHAMGLDHTFEGDGTLPTAEEDTQHSVMSYTNVKNTSISFTIDNGFISSSYVNDHDTTGYSYYDVIGLQAAYGANTSYNNTDTVYVASFSTTVQEVIWDAGGTDTIDASSATGACTVDLRESKFSSIDVLTASEQAAAKITEMGITDSNYITFINEEYTDRDNQNKLFTGENNLVISKGVVIENTITGSANDSVQDNSVDNTISTGAGDDTILLTEGGFDTVDGGTGDDTVQFNVASTAATVEQQADGSYVVLGDTFGAQLTGVETLQFTDTSTTLA